MIAISNILETYDQGKLSIDRNSIIANSHQIQFENILFDGFLEWNDTKALQIDEYDIEIIENSNSMRNNINTYRNLPKLTNFIVSSISISPLKKENHFINFKQKFSRINRIIFKDCIFNYNPMITDNKIWSIDFQKCTFLEGENLAKGLLGKSEEGKRIYFNECIFEDFNIGDIGDIQYNRDIELCRFYLVGGEIQNLTIENIEIASKFYINKQYSGNSKQMKIENLTMKNLIFKENFKLHNCEVNKVIIEDTDFEKHADFFMSIFKEGLNDEEENDKSINYKALNFKGLALFGDCEFRQLLKFQYVTFENFSHFRRAKFLKGLDLDYTNIQKEMNFFDIEGLDSPESRCNTSQETYRIIKHNFSKIGNTIEANKYHTLELTIHNKKTWEQRELTPTLLSDGIVSFLFWVTSYFSKYWFLPLFWIFIIGTITASVIGEVSLVNIIKYATITKMDYMDNYPILFVLNKSSLGFLYYQFILSVRKNTRK